MSVSEVPKAPIRGEIVHEGHRHAFEVMGARRTALEIQISAGRVPFDRVEVEDVTLTLVADPISIGRCRLEAFGEGAQAHLIPIDTPLRCDDLFKKRIFVRLDQGFDQLGLLQRRKDEIKPEIRAYTADLVYDLAVYRQLFDEIDASLANERPESASLIRQGIRENQGRQFLRFFDDRLAQLEKLVAGFSRGEHERHGFYFRRNVWGHILTSPFLARTNIRPRGYAGDSMMMQQIYDNTYQGESLFGELLHKHPIETAAAQAVRNRRKLIVDVVDESYRDRTDPSRPLRVLSVACGPAWEVRDLFSKPEDTGRFHCTLLDQDEEALGEAEQAIRLVGARLGSPIHVKFLRDSVRTMLMSKDIAAQFGRHDFIYSMGLFDYLTAPVARSVLSRLYELLEPGGRMIIGNFHVENPTRLYMEYWMDWVLLYRHEDDFHALARDLPGATFTTFREETRSQMFLDVRKPRG